MGEGWIKLNRKFLEWEWASVPEMVSLFIHLLLKASGEDRRWKGMDIKHGQLVTDIHGLATEVGITVQKLRTSLRHLRDSEEIIVKSTNKFTIITILNYDSYGSGESATNKQTTNKQQTNNKQDADNTKPDQQANKQNPPVSSCVTDSCKEVNDKTNKQLTNNQQTTNKQNSLVNSCYSDSYGSEGSATNKQTTNNTKKENSPHTPYKEKNILTTTSTSTTTPAYMRTREEDGNDSMLLDTEVGEMRGNAQWRDVACMNYHLSADELYGKLDEFRQWCMLNGYANGHPGGTRDAIRHFVGWMNAGINRQANGNNNARYGRQGLSAAQKLDEYVEAVKSGRHKVPTFLDDDPDFVF